MLKKIASLFIAFSLLAAPLVHASSSVCIGDACQMSEVSQKSSDDAQDNNKLTHAAHHCCAQAIERQDSQFVEPMLIGANFPFSIEDETASSLVLGPPLKPPSHA